MHTDESTNGKRKRVILLVAVLVLLGGSVTWNLVSSARTNVKPMTRKSTDFLVTWRCLECGHELENLAGTGPIPCPNCGKEAFYASILFSCPKHGVFRVAFNYDEEGKPTMVKVADGPWVAYIDVEAKRSGLHCPVCDGSMIAAESPRLPDDGAESTQEP